MVPWRSRMTSETIDILRQRPFFHQTIGLSAKIRIQHAIGAEAVTDTDSNADLVDLPRQGYGDSKHQTSV